MSIIETTEYKEPNLIAGTVRSAFKSAVAGTYHMGQLLGRNDTTNVYEAWDPDGADGVEIIKAVVVADRTLVASGTIGTYISGTEIMSVGIVDDAGEKLTLTQAQIEMAQDNGIFVKEV